MNRLRKGGWLVCGLALFGLGCSKGDSERLSRLAHKIAGKAEAIRQETNNRLHTDWQAFPPHLDIAGLESRVLTRLLLEKELAGTPFQVEAQGTTIILKGAVANLSGRRRAVDLAETTLGVEQVIDQMQTPDTE